MSQAPIINTQRLTLRGAELADFDGYAAFLASARAQYMDGPIDRTHAWDWFCNDTAHWSLFGYGGLIIERDNQMIGQVAITKGVRFPEAELGWFLLDGFDGQGYAFEAAFSLRDWAYENAGLETLVSYIDPRNVTSISLAERLGAHRDLDARAPCGETPENTFVYRHPTPDALMDGGMEAYA